MKNTRKVLAFVLCLALTFAVFSAFTPGEPVAAAKTIMDLEKEIKEKQSLLAKVKAEQASIQSNISSLESKSGQTSALLEQYQAEIDSLDAEINTNELIMQSYDIKRAEVSAKVALARENYDANVAMYKNLMQFIYENGDMNAFELLFSSENLADYLTRKDNYNDIMNSANEMISQIKLALNDLEALDAELAEAQKQYDDYLTELNRSKLEKETKVKQFEEIAASLNLNASELAEKYKDKNATIAQLNSEIKKLQAELQELYNSNAEFIWPVKTSSYRVSSQFGVRNDPFGKPTTEFHKGIDIACARGTPIVACKSGTVSFAQFAEYGSGYGGYGYCVVIYHGNGISTLYGHMDKIADGIKYKSIVKAGQVIGYVGTTGRSTGYHLHLSVIDTNSYSSKSGNYVNPNKYLPDGYYTKKS